MRFHSHRLSNGLRLLYCPLSSTKMTTVNLMYNVGSKDEHPEHTGFAHLFEHLMFAGSARVENFDKAVQEAYGENNAWTSPDVTNYYITLPAHKLETALFLESDRMNSLNINQRSLDIQKQVVLEEFKQRHLNQPYGDVSLLLRSMAYQGHPYSWPTIGKSLEHIEAFGLEDVHSFYRQYYSPDNAVLAITGEFDFDHLVGLTQKYFGAIEASKLSKPELPAWPQQEGPRFLEVERPVPAPALYKLWRAYAVSEEAYTVCDLLTDALAEGHSSRLYQQLIKERQIFSQVNIYVGGEGEAGAGSIQFSGKPAQGVSLEEAEKALEDCLNQIATEAPGQEELNKLINKHESAFLFRNTNAQNLATQACWYEILGSADNYLQETNKLKAVSGEDLRSMAEKIFRPENCSTLYYRNN